MQKLNRDTQKFAFKCSSILVGDEIREVYKRPITGSEKNSKRGRLKLTINDSALGRVFLTIPESQTGEDLMQIVFENGIIKREYTFDEVRANAEL